MPDPKAFFCNNDSGQFRQSSTKCCARSPRGHVSIILHPSVMSLSHPYSLPGTPNLSPQIRSQIRHHYLTHSAVYSMFDQFARQDGFTGAIKLQSLQHHIHADAIAELKTVRQGFLRVVDLQRNAIHVHLFNSRAKGPPREPIPGHRRIIQNRQTSIPLHRQMHPMGNLRGDTVPVQGGNQAEHGMRETGGGEDKVRVFNGGQVRHPVQASADQFYQPLVPELIELVPTIAQSQRFTQAKLAAVLAEQGLELRLFRAGGARIRQIVTTLLHLVTVCLIKASDSTGGFVGTVRSIGRQRNRAMANSRTERYPWHVQTDSQQKTHIQARPE